MDPMISVVIPVYRGESFLGPAIESVLNQTYQNFELILVDNNASETTRKIAFDYLNKFPQKIKIIKEQIQGASSARNTGILVAEGIYIALLDDDDFMLPENLEKQLKVIVENKKASMVFCGQSNIDKFSGSIIEKNIYGAQGLWKKREDLVKKAISLAFQNRNSESFRFTIPSTMFFEKEKALKIGLFDVRLNPYGGEDDDFCIRMFLEGDFIVNEEVLILYRKNYNESNVSNNSKNLFHFINQFNKLYKIMWENFGKDNLKSKKIFWEISCLELTLTFWSIVKFSKDKKDRIIIQALLFRIWKLSPFSFYRLKMFFKSFFPSRYYPKLFWFECFHSEGLDPSISLLLIKNIFKIPKI